MIIAALQKALHKDFDTKMKKFKIAFQSWPTFSFL